MIPTLAEFRIAFPEFSPVADATVQYYLDKAVGFLDKTAWGDCYNEAVLLYAAHYLALSQIRQAGANVSNGFVLVGSTAGILTEASADSLSVSYQPFQAAIEGDLNTAFFAQTTYGINYLALGRSCLPRGSVAGSTVC